jgi:chromosome segregation ATPase
VEPLLQIADELERRDAAAAAALLEVERLQRDLQDLRVEAAAVASFLAELPVALAARRADVEAAEAARVSAEARLHDAEAAQEQARKEDERLAAARAVQQASDGRREAELRLEQARGEVQQLEREREERRDEATRLETRSAALAARPPLAGETPPPAPGLDAVLEWGSRARGQLLLSRAALATERDRVVREATELVAGVLGEPLAATSVAGVRERLEQALHAG